MKCENPLSGDILQLNIVTFYPRQCVSQNENMCKIQFQEQLKDILTRMMIIPLNIQFNDNRFKSIDIKICSLTEMTGKTESTTSEESHYYLLRRARENSNKKKKSERNNGIDHNGHTNGEKQ
jgi:hypothetical protein